MMSSCSNTVSALQRTAPESADDSTLLRLVGAVASELSGFAAAIAVLGDSLAATAAARGTIDAVREMQAFDSLAQRARAYASVLHQIAQDPSRSEEEKRYELELLIGTLPFADVRCRFLDALEGTSRPDVVADHGGDAASHVQWFD
jgi:hypothetical protein